MGGQIFISIPFADSEFEAVVAAIRSAAHEKSYASYRTDDERSAEHLPEVIFRKIRESLVVVADVTETIRTC